MGRKIRLGITNDDIPRPGLKRLDEMSNIEYQVFSEFLPEVSAEQIRGFDMVVTAGASWTQQTVAGNKDLICVLYLGMGYDHIDVLALNKAEVMLCNSPMAVRRPMAVTIMTFILALAMRLLNKDKITREGRWEKKEDYYGDGLAGKTLGSVGVGNIGHEMFLLARPFGMSHIACDPYVTQEAVADAGIKLVDMTTVLTESDFLNISVPLNEQTRHLIGEKELRKMKKSAFLINTARGSIVDEAALIEALQEGRIRGAGLDVFEQEPTPIDNPLLKMENVVVAPHALCETEELFAGMWEQKFGQMSQIIRGEVPEALVNREVLDKPGFQARLKKFQESIR